MINSQIAFAKSKTLQIAGLFIISLLSLLFVTLLSSPIVSALSGSDFNAGRIIDDAVFFNSGSMNTREIQTFLDAKMPNCDTWGTQPTSHAGYANRAAWGAANGYPAPYTCLKSYRQDVPTVTNSGSDLCRGSIAGGSKSSAEIIQQVSQACGISPKVLIVLLQKEQGLVTDDWPWSIQYRSATGYGCPDTAPCDSEYYGFFNQVYQAAKAYKRYAANPANYNYRAGRNNSILFHPNTACGASNVYIENQATANLYIYTPYRPNTAALNNLYGTGDGCSSYGNRNFWRLFSDWFGSTRSSVAAYAWQYIGQEAFVDQTRTQQITGETTLRPNEKLYLRVKAKNIGYQPWQKNILKLGTYRQSDRSSIFYSQNWLASGRPATTAEDLLYYGDVANFEFEITAPNSVGTYREYFNLVAENITWLNDLGLYYDINVVDNNNENSSNPTKLMAGESLSSGQYLLSEDKKAVLNMQGDGNLVLYFDFNFPAWNTGTVNYGNNRLIMQGDGNLVLYSARGDALWSSGTDNHPNSYLIMQDDGNLVLYSAAGDVLWATYKLHYPSFQAYVNTTLPVGTMLPGQSLETADRIFKFVFQNDSNLVIYYKNKALWSSGTSGKEAAYLALQSDGNLVLYNHQSKALWNTSTDRTGNNNRLVLQQDGNLVIYSGLSAPWSTGTDKIR